MMSGQVGVWLYGDCSLLCLNNNPKLRALWRPLFALCFLAGFRFDTISCDSLSGESDAAEAADEDAALVGAHHGAVPAREG